MIFDRETENITDSPEKQSCTHINEAFNLKCEEQLQDFDNESMDSSDAASVQDIPQISNTVFVKNSSDVHIGDRTYLTIHHNVVSDSDIIKQIITDAIGSENIKTISNVKPNGIPSGSQNGRIVEELEYFNEITTDFAVPKSGTEVSGKGTQSTAPDGKCRINAKFSLCGYSFTHKLFAILVSAILLIVVSLSMGIWKLVSGESPTPMSTPQITWPSPTPPYGSTSNISDSNEDSRHLFTYPRPNGWYLMARKDWNARETQKTIVLLKHPVKNVIIAHTAGGTCYTEAQCCDKMLIIQAGVVADRGFEDIPYNFLVGGDGNAYEALGWNIVGYHSKGYNSVSIGIAFIGNFVFDIPSPQQLEAVKRLLQWGVEIGKLDPDYRLLPHNLTHATYSPGKNVYAIIKDWPHFTEKRFYIDS